MADHERNWGRLENSFGERRWNSIAATWPQFVGAPIDPPGSPPELTLSDLLEQGGVLVNLPTKNELTSVDHPRGEIPHIIFREAVFWLHKACHVLGASEAHVDIGMPTWSISAAYQSAFFAARSIMGFLGLSVGELQRLSVIADICRDMQGIRPKQIGRLGAFDENCHLRSLGVLFDHRQIWAIFQRTLKTARCSIWPEGWLHYLAHIDIGEITKQRHGLHYQLEYWILEDLHSFVHSDDFRDVAATGDGRELFDKGRGNFSLILGLILTQMALALFKDICLQTNRLIDEEEIFSAALSAERHPLFAEALQRDFGSTSMA